MKPSVTKSDKPPCKRSNATANCIDGIATNFADRPFPVKNFPFFYGWVVCLMSTIGIIMSIPGQTMGMAVFTDHFIDAFGLSRTQLSTAYLLGTLCSSFFLIRAGRFYDSSGARISMVASSIGLGLFVTFIALIDRITGLFQGATTSVVTWFTFFLILAGYFGVRFTGQGVLTSSSRNVLLAWFDRRRGVVTGTRAVFVTLGFSLAPPFLAYLISNYGWRGALLIMGAIVGLGFSLMALVFVRNAPEACGLKVDGDSGVSDDEPVWSIPDRTADEAIKSPVFWLYNAALAMYALFSTALVFHIVSIFSAAGRSSEEAVAYFFPVAVVSVSANLLGSWLSDRWPLKRLLLIKLSSFVVGALGLMNLQHDWGFYMLVAGFGTTGGLWGVLSSLAFVRYFGRRFLGEISGINMTMIVIGSAIGPVMFSLGKDLSGSYGVAIWINLFLLAALLITSMVIKQDEPERVLTSK